MTRNATQSTRRFLADCCGLAALEFALAAPVMLTLFAGTLEMARYLLMQQKTQTIVAALSDLIAQSDSTQLTNTAITNLMNAAGEVMKPFSFAPNGYVVISSVAKTGNNPPTVRWQRTSGSFTQQSNIGTPPNGTATLPSGFSMSDKDNIIVTELFYNYTPLFGSGIVGSSVWYKTSYFKPRLGALSAPPT